MPSLEFEVYCGCGEGLCNETVVKGGTVTVGPCSRCKEFNYEEGYTEGYDVAERRYEEEQSDAQK